MENKGIKITGIICTALSIITGAMLIYLIVMSKLLPLAFTIGVSLTIIVIIVLAKAIIGFTGHKNRGRAVLGIIITLMITVLFTLASYFLYQPLAALKNITNSKEQVTKYGVYVLDESSANSIEDVADGKFSIQENNAQKNKHKNVQRAIESDVNKKINIIEEKDLKKMAKSLVDRKTDAAIINASVIEALSGENAKETKKGNVYEPVGLKVKLRCIATYEVKEKIKNSKKSKGTFTVLFSGSDTRGALNTTGRNDVNILAVVNPKTKTILLINTPRDYYVPLSISGGVKDKLTHAGVYGEQVSMDTIAMLYNTNVDYYFRINFVGFKQVIDTLGGITVNSDYSFAAGGFSYVRGDNFMDGEKALAFSRERYSFEAGDNQRGKNQMAVIKAVVKKMSTPAILRNYSALWNNLSDCFITSVPYDTISNLVSKQLVSSGGWNVQSYSVSGTGSRGSTYSMPGNLYVMIPDQNTVDKAKSLIEDVHAGRTIDVE